MSQTTTVIYENGILRPVAPLDLPEHEEIKITFEKPETMRDKVRKAIGLPEVVHIEPEISPERREELAKLFSGEKQLGEYIREDRDAR